MPMLRGLLIVTLLATLVGCKRQDGVSTSPATQPTSRTELRVAAAADLQFALVDLLKSFEQVHPENHVSVTYGSSGNFYSQLSNKAPFDVFLSADASYPQKLVDQGLAKSTGVFGYAIG